MSLFDHPRLLLIAIATGTLIAALCYQSARKHEDPACFVDVRSYYDCFGHRP